MQRLRAIMAPGVHKNLFGSTPQYSVGYDALKNEFEGRMKNWKKKLRNATVENKCLWHSLSACNTYGGPGNYYEDPCTKRAFYSSMYEEATFLGRNGLYGSDMLSQDK